MVKSNNIIGIFDMDNTTVSKWTKKFLNCAEKRGQVISVTTDLPKTFVVMSPRVRHCKGQSKEKNKEQQVYLSQISSATLRKRTGYSYTTRTARNKKNEQIIKSV